MRLHERLPKTFEIAACVKQGLLRRVKSTVLGQSAACLAGSAPRKWM